MPKERIAEIIQQVIRNPQVSFPPISYRITDIGVGGEDYTSEYIDMGDFKSYLDRLEKQLVSRLSPNGN
jgi:hypothetical protein